MSDGAIHGFAGGQHMAFVGKYASLSRACDTTSSNYVDIEPPSLLLFKRSIAQDPTPYTVATLGQIVPPYQLDSGQKFSKRQSERGSMLDSTETG